MESAKNAAASTNVVFNSVRQLNLNVWCHAAATAAIELDMLGKLDDNPSPRLMSAALGIPIPLVTALLEVLTTMGLIDQIGDRLQRSPALKSGAVAPDLLVAKLKTADLLSRSFQNQLHQNATAFTWNSSDHE